MEPNEIQTIEEKKREMIDDETENITCSHCGCSEECTKVTAGDEVAYLCEHCNDDLNG